MVKLPLRNTLRLRLFAFISLLLVSTIAVNAWQNARSFYSVLMLSAQEKTLQGASLAANGVGAVLESWLAQIVVVTNGVGSMPREKYKDFIASFVAANPDFIAFEMLQLAADRGDDGDEIAYATTTTKSDERFGDTEAEQAIEALRAESHRALRDATKGAAQPAIVMANLTPKTGVPALAIAVSFRVADSPKPVWGVLTVWQTKVFTALMNAGSKTAILVDKHIRVVSASNAQNLGRISAAARHPMRQTLESSAAPTGFRQWRTESGKTALGAFARLTKYDLTVLTASDGEAAAAAIRQIVVRTLLWAALLLLVAVFATVIASAGVTRSLQNLMSATLRIAQGEFGARVSVKGLKSLDEVGILSLAVNHMSAQISLLMDERVEKARLEGELQTAKMVQETFFPRAAEADELLSLSAFFQPATECGGDWWGHYKLSPRHHLVCIADATGHGVPAALVTAMVFAAASVMSRRLAEQCGEGLSPSLLLTELNQTLCASHGRQNTMTFFAGIFDFQTGTIVYANASHNFPALLRRSRAWKDGEAMITRKDRMDLSASGNPLGIDPTNTYEDKTIELMPGDRIVFYTDGLFECRNTAREQWGKRRFTKQIERTALADLEVFKNKLVQAAFGHFGTQPTDDDITVVVADVSPDWRKPQPQSAPAPLTLRGAG
jgi:serine phosphatase RsbU (regulator of sigma subunit)